MASTTKVLFLLSQLISFCVFLLDLPSPCNAQGQGLKRCKFNAIYQLGDSSADTGNLIIENSSFPAAKLPYGETFFKKPTGRFSDGLLIIDYFAQSAGFPLLDPYLKKKALFSKGRGVNFAVAGSTALPVDVLAQMNISSPFTNSSLSTQLDWMETHFESICLNAKHCAKKLNRSLFVVGEIGVNDYNFGLLQGKKTIEEAMNMVPQVVQAIKDAVKKILGYGASRVVVPGNFPFGCLPIYLTLFKRTDASAYDEYYCLKSLNELSIYHNDNLQKAIKELKKDHTNATILYGDYYNAFKWVYRFASNLGFDPSSLQKSCCGIGGDYDFNISKLCGASGVPVFPYPDQRISWDGIHLTQKAHKYISFYVKRRLLPQLDCDVDFWG